MELTTLVTWFFLAAILVVLLVLYFTYRSGQSDSKGPELETALSALRSELLEKQTELLLGFRTSLDQGQQVINERLAEGTSSMDRRLSVLSEIENRLGRLATQTANIENIGKNIQSLSELLRPPKLRGQLGELLLENILAQVLPPSAYELQYRYPAGQRVDAVVKLHDRVMPLDAKFPMESFQRLAQTPEDQRMRKEFESSFKKQIDSLADKYIKPEENTTDFAVMYIPAEGVYHEFVSNKNLGAFEYALSKRVIPSSPGHLYAFLASVSMLYAQLSLAGGDLAESSRIMVAGLRDLGELLNNMVKHHDRIEGSLRNINTAFDKTRRDLALSRNALEKLLGGAGDDRTGQDGIG